MKNGILLTLERDKLCISIHSDALKSYTLGPEMSRAMRAVVEIVRSFLLLLQISVVLSVVRSELYLDFHQLKC